MLNTRHESRPTNLFVPCIMNIPIKITELKDLQAVEESVLILSYSTDHSYSLMETVDQEEFPES
jgi:hypothetical protein